MKIGFLRLRTLHRRGYRIGSPVNQLPLLRKISKHDVFECNKLYHCAYKTTGKYEPQDTVKNRHETFRKALNTFFLHAPLQRITGAYKS